MKRLIKTALVSLIAAPILLMPAKASASLPPTCAARNWARIGLTPAREEYCSATGTRVLLVPDQNNGVDYIFVHKPDSTGKPITFSLYADNGSARVSAPLDGSDNFVLLGGDGLILRRYRTQLSAIMDMEAGM